MPNRAHETEICWVEAAEILDSRGWPTLTASVGLANGTRAAASVPAGASTGRFEAAERRDFDGDRYGGRGVRAAVASIEGEIQAALLRTDARAQGHSTAPSPRCTVQSTKAGSVPMQYWPFRWPRRALLLQAAGRHFTDISAHSIGMTELPECFIFPCP